MVFDLNQRPFRFTGLNYHQKIKSNVTGFQNEEIFDA
jgi:hypothetical protein